MRRSAEFDATVKYGMRSVQPDLLVYLLRGAPTAAFPRVGLIIAKRVGSAVERHQIARRLRHVSRTMLADLKPSDRMVIRALPGSRGRSSASLEQQVRRGLRRGLARAGTRE